MVVIIGTALIIILKFLFTLYEPWSRMELTNMFNVREDLELESWGHLVLGIVLSVISVGAEVILMTMNVESIRFKADLNAVKNSWGISKKLWKVSIFL